MSTEGFRLLTIVASDGKWKFYFAYVMGIHVLKT